MLDKVKHWCMSGANGALFMGGLAYFLCMVGDGGGAWRKITIDDSSSPCNGAIVEEGLWSLYVTGVCGGSGPAPGPAPAPGGSCTCYPCGSSVPTTSFGGCGPPNPADCSATAGNPTAGCWSSQCGAKNCECASGTCQGRRLEGPNATADFSVTLLGQQEMEGANLRADDPKFVKKSWSGCENGGMASTEAQFPLALLERTCGSVTGAAATMVICTICFTVAWLLNVMMFFGKEPSIPCGISGKTTLTSLYVFCALLQWIALGEMKTPLGATGSWVVFGSLCTLTAACMACFSPDSGGGLGVPLATAKPYQGI